MPVRAKTHVVPKRLFIRTQFISPQRLKLLARHHTAPHRTTPPICHATPGGTAGQHDGAVCARPAALDQRNKLNGHTATPPHRPRESLEFGGHIRSSHTNTTASSVVGPKVTSSLNVPLSPLKVTSDTTSVTTSVTTVASHHATSHHVTPRHTTVA